MRHVLVIFVQGFQAKKQNTGACLEGSEGAELAGIFQLVTFCLLDDFHPKNQVVFSNRFLFEKENGEIVMFNPMLLKDYKITNVVFIRPNNSQISRSQQLKTGTATSRRWKAGLFYVQKFGRIFDAPPKWQTLRRDVLLVHRINGCC